MCCCLTVYVDILTSLLVLCFRGHVLHIIVCCGAFSNSYSAHYCVCWFYQTNIMHIIVCVDSFRGPYVWQYCVLTCLGSCSPHYCFVWPFAFCFHSIVFYDFYWPILITCSFYLTFVGPEYSHYYLCSTLLDPYYAHHCLVTCLHSSSTNSVLFFTFAPWSSINTTRSRYHHHHHHYHPNEAFRALVTKGAWE